MWCLPRDVDPEAERGNAHVVFLQPDSRVAIPIKKNRVKSRVSDPFFWEFFVISEHGSQIYIVNSVILIF